MSWIPADRAARSLTEILLHPGKLDPILHLENPTRQPARDIMAIIAYELEIPYTDPLPFDEWLQRVNEMNTGDSLVEFLGRHFEDLALGAVILDTTKSRATSRTLRESSGISRELLLKYVRTWKQQGLFT